MDTKDFEDIYSDDEPNELGSIQGNAKAIIDLISPIIDSPDVLCSRELDTINTFCIEAENNANYEDNWISRIVEIEDCIDTIKDNYPDIGEKVEELIDKGTVVLITSAGTESINLQRADTMIFYDPPFAWLSFIQAVR